MCACASVVKDVTELDQSEANFISQTARRPADLKKMNTFVKCVTLETRERKDCARPPDGSVEGVSL